MEIGLVLVCGSTGVNPPQQNVEYFIDACRCAWSLPASQIVSYAHVSKETKSGIIARFNEELGPQGYSTDFLEFALNILGETKMYQPELSRNKECSLQEFVCAGIVELAMKYSTIVVSLCNEGLGNGLGLCPDKLPGKKDGIPGRYLQLKHIIQAVSQAHSKTGEKNSKIGVILDACDVRSFLGGKGQKTPPMAIPEHVSLLCHPYAIFSFHVENEEIAPVPFGSPLACGLATDGEESVVHRINKLFREVNMTPLLGDGDGDQIQKDFEIYGSRFIDELLTQPKRRTLPLPSGNLIARALYGGTELYNKVEELGWDLTEVDPYGWTDEAVFEDYSLKLRRWYSGSPLILLRKVVVYCIDNDVDVSTLNPRYHF